MLDLGLLDPDDAAAVLLAARHGLTYTEIAERTGDPPDVVLLRLRRGLRHARAFNAVPSSGRPPVPAHR